MLSVGALPASPREKDLKRVVAMSSNSETLSCVSPYKSLDSCHKSLNKSSSNVSIGSMPGPELPVHFSEFSIASNKDSYDPWGSLRERATEMESGGDSSEPCGARLPSFVARPLHSGTLTSPSFRRLADKDRSFTASAPSGARPPCAPKRSLLVDFESDQAQPIRRGRLVHTSQHGAPRQLWGAPSSVPEDSKRARAALQGTYKGCPPGPQLQPESPWGAVCRKVPIRPRRTPRRESSAPVRRPPVRPP